MVMASSRQASGKLHDLDMWELQNTSRANLGYCVLSILCRVYPWAVSTPCGSHPSSSWLWSYRVGAASCARRSGLFGSGFESQPGPSVASRGDELDTSALEGALELQERGKPHRKKTAAELQSLDR